MISVVDGPYVLDVKVHFGVKVLEEIKTGPYAYDYLLQLKMQRWVGSS